MASEDHMASQEPSPAGGVKPSREAELQALLARVEAAGPDSYLDASLELALDPANFYEKALQESPPFTASLDAALALVDQVLTGFGWIIYSGAEVKLFRGTEVHQARCATAALSMCAALMKALIAEAASPESGSTGVWTNQSPTPLSKTEVQS